MDVVCPRPRGVSIASSAYSDLLFSPTPDPTECSKRMRPPPRCHRARIHLCR
ncbi:hypothetical protein [Lysobacter gummosus]|uniref:hypothetical protein n=1 Tax=Lysobacter gummosus TaxID=262324 RepID=UPI00362ABE39